MSSGPLSPRRRAVSRFRRWPPLFFYAEGKTALDPAYPAVVAALKDSPLPLLDLGCGMGHGSIALARQGAKVIAVDADPTQIAHARVLAEQHAVKIELHHADLADIAFCRSASVDLLISCYALAGIQDLDRIFRQAHRVLQPEAAFLFSLPHPFTTLLRAAGDGNEREDR